MYSIWLIDDDNISLFISEKIIKTTNNNCNVITFNKSVSALQKYLESEERPDIVFLDINMPLCNGWDFLEKVEKSEEAHSDFYILSSSDHLPELIQSQKYTLVKGYILKPLTIESIEKIFSEKQSESYLF